MNELMLYVHIPFCVKKCLYCDFLSFQAETAMHKEYVYHLKKEIRQKAKLGNGRRVSSIFFGGGTPSSIGAGLICELLKTLKAEFDVQKDAEITIEVNPATVTGRDLEIYRKAGINRISIGLQSTENGLLKKLGRIHTVEEFLYSYQLAKKAGFTNINVDLMMAIPGQSLKQWRDTLEKIAKLGVEHISAYSLIIEEGTAFYERYQEDLKLQQDGEQPRELPDEDTERSMYQITKEILEKYGFKRYEISNYAKPGAQCRHNLGYWIRQEYLGFGLGAASFFDKCRWKNTSKIREYLEDIYEDDQEEQKLSFEEEMSETMILGLRLTRGVSKKKFEEEYGCSIEKVYGSINEKLKKEGLLAENDKYLFFTPKGFDLANYCMAKYI
ncbi:radical SAM family heme chaperone HemW [Eubacterium oxidoreducens]|uniref:Heme chaperone HemW n=1 Tax=Eubacterium oxidoreducens TaxID=1732 RepID=A0A1G6B6C6_EUBOX|nr:radical SAM family heme chaperone HemW [Eubacterium oxidoreducens]SDB16208.1 oxygen-independent coproporphyrinogen-3 oxidase [Eubacterium oxidoreducens]